MAWLFRCLAVRNSGLNLARKGRRHRYFPFSFLHFLRQFKVFFRPAGLVGHFVRQSAKKCRTFSETVGMSGMSDDLRFHWLQGSKATPTHDKIGNSQYYEYLLKTLFNGKMNIIFGISTIFSSRKSRLEQIYMLHPKCCCTV